MGDIAAATPAPAEPVKETKVDPFAVSDQELSDFLAAAPVDKVGNTDELLARLATVNERLEEHRKTIATSAEPEAVKDLVRNLLSQKKVYEKQLEEVNG